MFNQIFQMIVLFFRSNAYHKIHSQTIRFVVTLLLASSLAYAEEQGVDFRLSFDHFIRTQSDLEGTNGISVVRRFDNDTYWGGTVYSAAFGHAGGFFVGGFEAGQIVRLPFRSYLDAQFYIGGGGGATQVPGNGLMLRPRLALGKTFDAFSLSLGASWIRVTGSEINTPSIEFAFRKPLDLAYIEGHPAPIFNDKKGFKLTTAKPVITHYIPQKSLKRNSSESLGELNLFGVEFGFTDEGTFEYFLQTDGVVGGDAEGYADWFLGIRRYADFGFISLFSDVSAGVGGGGAVDTGGGINLSLNFGVQIDTFYNIHLEPSFAFLYSPSGNFFAYAPTMKIAIPLNTKKAEQQPVVSRWQVSTGLTHIPTNDRLRKVIDGDKGSPSLMNLKIDTFVAKNSYFTGQAYTAFAGDAGGFQIGLVGAGHRFNISPNWNLSTELALGAGGGAGIDTSGGALAAANIDVNYALSDSFQLFAGGGWLRTLKSSGMNGPTMEAGLKFLFTLFH